MNKIMLSLLLIFLFAVLPVSAENYSGKVVADGSAMTDSGFAHQAQMTATLSYDVIGSLLEVGFSNSSDVGEIYESISRDKVFTDDITLSDGLQSDIFDGIAVGPDNLYIFYKILNQESLDSISVSISALDDSSEEVSIPWVVYLDLVGQAGETVRYVLSSPDGTPMQNIYKSQTKVAENSAAVYKVTINASYESNESNSYPAGEYTGTIEIQILGV